MKKAASGQYYWKKLKNDVIGYYDLNKKRIQLAKAKCSECGYIIESKSCGDWVQCSCGKSFVDTCRGVPGMHRYGGHAVEPTSEDKPKISQGQKMSVWQKLLNNFKND